MSGSSGLPLIYKMVKTVFPMVNNCLENWKKRASAANDEMLRTQSLASIEKKKFHCQGGCAYVLYPNINMDKTLHFIIALQTISDYIDNLCDRAGILDEAAFRQLHLAMADAVDPDTELHDYYSLYPHKDDGGYLNALVEVCRAQVQKLPSFTVVQERIRLLVSYYSELQTLKHVPPDLREGKLTSWATPLLEKYQGVSIWEFCAATGSTLGIFILFAAAQCPGITVEEADSLFYAYFPWVCALHIQLDYFIDNEEDKKEGDFNFTSYYKDKRECAERLAFLVEQSLCACSRLRYPGFHNTVIRGLLAMYLSDPKTACIDKHSLAIILKSGGRRARLYHGICKLLRDHKSL